MKYSQLLTKTQKITKEYDSKNAELLIKAGFVDQTMAGVYTFLPLGLRVLTKIENIVRRHMDEIGAELLMPSLAPKTLWETTGRLETIDVLFKALGANANSQARNSSEYVLNCTHEDIITPIAQKFRTSYKDFPFAVYQIQTKFRNEARPKSGIMRGREFRMKDLYSFHTSQAEFQAYYDKAKEVYAATFAALGLGADTVMTLASGGDFTNDYSHEFQTRCEAGEDIVFYDEANKTYYNREVAPSKAPAVVQDSEQQPLTEMYGEHITGMDALVKFLKVPAEKCVKTMIYTADDAVVAVAVRGYYEVNEDKLKKILGCKKLSLATPEVIKKVTNAIVGYAGFVGLPETVRVIADEALEEMVNFECGGNKDHVHLINVNWGRDVKKPERFYDVKLAQAGDLNPTTGKPMEFFKAAEVGNIFPLASRFPEAFKYRYIDTNGKEQPVLMGSYGIGTSRVMGVLVEKFHDENGIIWPKQVAPFQIHLISLRGGEEQAAALYAALQTKGIDVLWDERDTTPGAKFADADLIGCPIRLVVSAKTAGKIEYKERAEKNSLLITDEDLWQRVSTH
ncbi:proline--tRNA ligase [Candidatus Woesebacteria bacterium]|nr:proline--tRNA ligase [Candidatus Woesebacteria bacterium]